jgi:hypothetical protein
MKMIHNDLITSYIKQTMLVHDEELHNYWSLSVWWYDI